MGIMINDYHVHQQICMNENTLFSLQTDLSNAKSISHKIQSQYRIPRLLVVDRPCTTPYNSCSALAPLLHCIPKPQRQRNELVIQLCDGLTHSQYTTVWS
jgi:hypothetical protein